MQDEPKTFAGCATINHNGWQKADSHAAADQTFGFLEIFSLACGLPAQLISHPEIPDVVRLVRSRQDKAFIRQDARIVDAGAEQRVPLAAIKLLVLSHERLVKQI